MICAPLFPPFLSIIDIKVADVTISFSYTTTVDVISFNLPAIFKVQSFLDLIQHILFFRRNSIGKLIIQDSAIAYITL